MKKVLVRDVPRIIAERADFKAGDLHGVDWKAESPMYPIARRIDNMPAEERAALLEAIKVRQEAPSEPSKTTIPSGLLYLVSSYGVPIAWMTGDGVVHRTKLRHSDATAKHIDIAVEGLQSLSIRLKA
jgi:hypothetical protein